MPKLSATEDKIQIRLPIDHLATNLPAQMMRIAAVKRVDSRSTKNNTKICLTRPLFSHCSTRIGRPMRKLN